MIELCPITLRRANDFVADFHRHNGRTARNGGKWAIGLTNGEKLVGVAIVGNPLSATYMDGYTAEVLRVCTTSDADKGSCSKLYAACWRAWRSMGGKKLITYTLQTETGASLRGAGWKIVGETKPQKQGSNWRKQEYRDWQPIYGQMKFRWETSRTD